MSSAAAIWDDRAADSTTVAWSPTITNTRTEIMAQAADDDLCRYLSFDTGWDGYDGLTFAPDTITKARAIVAVALEAFLRAGVTPSEITPGPASDGSVDVEIAVSGRTLIITLDRDNPLPVRVYAAAGEQIVEREDRLEDGGLVGWLGWLTRKNGIPPVLAGPRRNPGSGNALARCL